MVDVLLSYWGRFEILYVEEIYRNISIVIRSRNCKGYLVILHVKVGQSLCIYIYFFSLCIYIVFIILAKLFMIL